MRRYLMCLALITPVCHAQGSGLELAQPVIQAITKLSAQPWGLVITAGRWLLTDTDPTYEITVQGRGDTHRQQLDNAFRTAVEQATGTLIISESQAQQQVLIKDHITAHSAAYIQRYKVLEQTDDSVTIQAWIKRTTLNQAWTTVSFAQAFVAPARTLQHQYTTGDAVLQQVLTSYPQNSFQVEILHTEYAMTRNRGQELRLRYTVSWSKPWLRAWQDTVRLTTTNLDRLDAQRQRQLVETLVDRRPQIQLTVRDPAGQVVFQACKGYSELDHQQVKQHGQRFVTYEPGQVRLHNTVMHGHLAITVPPGREHLYHHAEITVIAINQCR